MTNGYTKPLDRGRTGDPMAAWAESDKMNDHLTIELKNNL